MMQLIRKIGNLRFMCEYNLPFNDITVYAINGTDVVKSEVFYSDAIPAECMKAMLRRDFDIFHEYDINGWILQDIKIEYDGNLISGRLNDYEETEYFKRIDDTPYYKHFTYRPAM